jgi:DNA-binding transcriptional ArsR family regulator
MKGEDMGVEFHSKPMKEIVYRESRIAKVIGEPAKYAIINLLLRHGAMSVGEIARAIHRAESTISHHLAMLKGLEIVRYEVKTSGVYYWIKYPKELRLIVKSLKIFVKRTLEGIEDES